MFESQKCISEEDTFISFSTIKIQHFFSKMQSNFMNTSKKGKYFLPHISSKIAWLYTMLVTAIPSSLGVCLW